MRGFVCPEGQQIRKREWRTVARVGTEVPLKKSKKAKEGVKKRKKKGGTSKGEIETEAEGGWVAVLSRGVMNHE
jgi:hypothetical protein